MRRRWIWIVIGLGAATALFVLATLVDAAVFYNKIHAGVSISGVELGGKTKDEAISAVTDATAGSLRAPIMLTAGEKTWTVTPEEVGAKVDVRQAAAAAMAVTRENNLLVDIGKRWELYFSRKTVSPTVTLSQEKLDSFVARVAKLVDIPSVNAGLAIRDGKIEVIESVDGRVVDRAKLAETLNSLIVDLRTATVQVPVMARQPAVTADDNEEARRQAETMISGPVTILAAGKSWTISSEQLAADMGFRSESRNGVKTLVPFIDPSKLQPLLDAIAPEVAKKPKDASFDSDGTRAWVVPGENGEALDASATAQAITDASLRRDGRNAPVVVKTKEPALTTAEAEAMGINDKLSSYSTTYVGTKDRQQNVRKATEYGTNVFLAPGEVYDTDKQFGPRTPERGYRLAPGITGPNTLEDVLGGGICQVSTTLFNAVFFAGLDVVERWNHSIYIDHYPKGRDATVTGGGKNLRFRNDTGHYLWIRGTSNGITTTISIYGTNDGRKVTYTTGAFYNVKDRTTVTVPNPSLATGKTTVIDKGQTGRSIKVVRVVTARDGTVLHKDSFVSTWLMYPITIGVGSATTTTTKSTTTTTTGASSATSTSS